ncbi:MAG: zf-HC2 domain-containing protein [Eubacteriales bacterium]|nr:zf-HC2 domain-containing protein [Eubacteriales bacterium]
MTKKCGMARDLMPLVIDNAASEESREYVFRHMEGCEQCKHAFEEMQEEVGAPAPGSETDLAFAHSVWQLKKKQKIRKIWICALCVFLAFCLAFAGAELYNGLRMHNLIDKGSDELDVSIFTLPSGEVQLHLQSKEGTGPMSEVCRRSTLLGEDGRWELYIWAQKPRFAALTSENTLNDSVLPSESSGLALRMIDGALYTVSHDYNIKTRDGGTDEDGQKRVRFDLHWYAPTEISRIYYGRPYQDDPVLLYAEGDELEEISPEKYIKILEATFDRDMYLPTDFFSAEETYTSALAQAWVRGEKMPPIPRKFLPSVYSFPEYEGAREIVTLIAHYQTVIEPSHTPKYSTMSEPLVIAEHTSAIDLPVAPPDADEAQEGREPLPASTKAPE